MFFLPVKVIYSLPDSIPYPVTQYCGRIRCFGAASRLPIIQVIVSLCCFVYDNIVYFPSIIPAGLWWDSYVLGSN